MNIVPATKGRCNHNSQFTIVNTFFFLCGGESMRNHSFPKCAHRGACEAADVWGPCDTVGGGFVVVVTFSFLFFC